MNKANDEMYNVKMTPPKKDVNVLRTDKLNMFGKDINNIEIDTEERSENKMQNESLKTETFSYFLNPEDMQFNVWKYIFNPEEKSLLGRTKKRWGICLLFYFVFYTVLVTFWATMLYIALCYYSGHEGPWVTAEDRKILGPGIAHFPPHFQINITHDAKECIGSIDKFLSSYRKKKATDYNDCQSTSSPPEACYVDITALGDCAPGSSYGYDRQMPCIMLKLNRAYGWKPDLYNKIEELPKEIPANLKDHIQKQMPNKMDHIWLSCEGLRKKDKDLLKKISYWPDRGFPSHFYPFRGNKKQLSPLVAIQIESNKRGVTIVIHCQAWAKNLSTNQDYGSNVKFEITFD